MGKFRFQRKIIIANIAMILVLFLGTSFFIYSYLLNISKTNFEQNIMVEAVGICTLLENSIENADEVALQIAANSTIIQSFEEISKDKSKTNYFITNPSIDSKLKSLMHSYTLKSNSIGRINLFNANKDYVFVGNAVDYGYNLKDTFNENFLRDIQQRFAKEQKASLFYAYEKDPFSNSSYPQLSITREIKDYMILPGKIFGYVHVQIPINHINHYFYSLRSKSEGYIINKTTKKILYTYKETETGKDIIEQNIANMDKEGIFSDNNFYYYVSPVNDTGLVSVVFKSNDSLFKYAVSTFLWVILLTCGTVLILSYGQIKLIKGTTKPIEDLCKMVEQLQDEKNLVQVPIVNMETNDELQKLSNAYTGLMNSLKTAIEKNMLSQMSESRAHLFALQSQMNPHFIHNIITIISSMSVEQDYKKIPLVCEKLSHIIRYTSTYEDEFVTLDKEFETTLNYLELMKLRYENRFNFQFQFSDSGFEGLVPKFIFQPLLENSFVHGLSLKEFPWYTEISVFAHKGKWEAVISDNGNGISDEKLNKILNECKTLRVVDLNELMQGLKIGGLSIKNIYARLFLLYGDNMLFEVSNKLNGGFIITIGGVLND